MCRSGLLLLALLAPLLAQQHGESEDPFRLSDAPIPLTQTMPARPIPPLEWGEPFKGTGPIRPGYRLPSGAVWQPQFILFGAARFGLLSSETAQGRVDEWANRLDVFGNLQLTGSERIVVGLRNLDQAGTFSGYVFNSEVPSLDEGKQDGLNADLQTLFFEGDFGELFPNLSPRDFRPTDWGFALGRQNLFFQEGLLVDDVVDGIGITRNSLQPKGTSNLRLTFFYGWGNIDRPASGSAENLLAVFSSMDTKRVTYDCDLTFTQGKNGQTDQWGFGLSATRRFIGWNSSARLLLSKQEDDSAGGLALHEASRTLHHSEDLLYFNVYWAWNTFRTSSLGAGRGGPLKRVGISFAGAGLGHYGSALSSSAQDTFGFAAGRQWFLAGTRRQFIGEAAARFADSELNKDAYAATGRYQMALGRRYILAGEASVIYTEGAEQMEVNGRVEGQVRF